MARETTTVQCYPLDSTINRKIREYEAFGWELIGNQRCEEDKGTYGGYRHYSTFNKLTFTRDKSASWYTEVAALENRYYSLINSEPYQRKPSKILLWASIMLLMFAVAMLIPTLTMLSMGFQMIPGVPAIVLTLIDIILFVIYGVKKSRYKKDYKARLSEWERTSMQEAASIRKQAEALVNG